MARAKAKPESIDWGGVVNAILDRLLLTQGELAERCGVSQQTVSAWKTGGRSPGRSAQRRLSQLTQDIGEPERDRWFPTLPTPVLAIGETRGEWKTTSSPAEPKDHRGARRGGEDPTKQELLRLFETLSDAERRDVLDYLRFKTARRRP
ncbi:MAG: hypothetical protein A3K19_03640 [Lentisphaerae bacterium RIFOXYB12_FULL_65_16]|nr:MAG: hypothetical protein A3K18_30070 [Lentisphaerae bacterium RIFOXYA12_64_32]OGV86606.1 MAG: hypothetical protein A3K19_03640 [Lentisphaerae bacterium RIFOXYB12_FULL_65_16]